MMMKNLLTLAVVLSTCLSISACLKKTINPPSSTFTGNWRLVSDSTTIQFWGLWNGRPDTGVIYMGKPADHYNFLVNGKLYIAEDGNLDTVNYIALSHDTLEIKYISEAWLNPFKYIVSNHTDHNMTLTSAFPSVTPETAYTYVIKLTK
jgi:hypothetical protein